MSACTAYANVHWTLASVYCTRERQATPEPNYLKIAPKCITARYSS